MFIAKYSHIDCVPWVDELSVPYLPFANLTSTVATTALLKCSILTSLSYPSCFPHTLSPLTVLITLWGMSGHHYYHGEGNRSRCHHRGRKWGASQEWLLGPQQHISCLYLCTWAFTCMVLLLLNMFCVVLYFATLFPSGFPWTSRELLFRSTPKSKQLMCVIKRAW